MYEVPPVPKAHWEIRSGMSPGKGGKVVASGQGRAKVTRTGAVANADMPVYRVEVDGLHVKLSPGRYWLSVSPVGYAQPWFLCPTRGANAVGDPRGDNGGALVSAIWRRGVAPMGRPDAAVNSRFEEAEVVGRYGQRESPATFRRESSSCSLAECGGPRMMYHVTYALSISARYCLCFRCAPRLPRVLRRVAAGRKKPLIIRI